MCNRKVLLPIPDWFKENKDYYNFEPDHPEYGINRYGEYCFRIDACIAPMLRWLWSKKIYTTGCCCGHSRDFPRITFMYANREYVIDQFDHPAYQKMWKNFITPRRLRKISDLWQYLTSLLKRKSKIRAVGALRLNARLRGRGR